MRVDVVTVFPQYLAPLDLSLIGRARREGLLDLRVHDLRDWAHDRHRTVDGPPAGGGAGMVMRPEPWGEALDALLGSEDGGTDGGTGGGPGDDAADRRPVLLVPTPSGERFTQATAAELAAEPRLVFACGRYEGIDARVLAEAGRLARVREVSLGDYVLCGGEVAVLVVVEAVARLLPGVVGNPASLLEESHADGLLEYPLYTRPASWRGHDVPAVLLSGDHAKVARWRRNEQLRRTARRRPDLLAALPADALDDADRAVLAAAGWDTGGDQPRPAG